MSVVWTCVNPASPNVPFAGRRSLPATDTNGAIGAFVRGISQAANNASLNYRISQELAGYTRLAENHLPRDGRGGALVVLAIFQQDDGQQPLQRFSYGDFVGVFALASHGIWKFSHSARVEEATNPPTTQLIYRYFWGTRP